MTYLGVPISWPKNSSNGSPEPRKFHLALFFIHTTSAESIDQNFLKKLRSELPRDMGALRHFLSVTSECSRNAPKRALPSALKGAL